MYQIWQYEIDNFRDSVLLRKNPSEKVSLKYTVLSKGYKESQFYKFTVIVANEPYTNQLYLQKSTWFLFTFVYFDSTVF